MRILIVLTFLIGQQTMQLFDFNKDSNIKDWRIVDDVVMGGRSSGSFELNSEGHAVFSGRISLENNGGFSSVRHPLSIDGVRRYTKFVIKVKGHGKSYQFRAKKNEIDRASYIYEFETSTDWMIIEIPIIDMYPAFRGNRLNIPNFNSDRLEEIAILIGNKKEQEFKLMIDSISLQ